MIPTYRQRSRLTYPLSPILIDSTRNPAPRGCMILLTASDTTPYHSPQNKLIFYPSKPQLLAESTKTRSPGLLRSSVIPGLSSQDLRALMLIATILLRDPIHPLPSWIRDLVRQCHLQLPRNFCRALTYGVNQQLSSTKHDQLVLHRRRH